MRLRRNRTWVDLQSPGFWVWEWVEREKKEPIKRRNVVSRSAIGRSHTSQNALGKGPFNSLQPTLFNMPIVPPPPDFTSASYIVGCSLNNCSAINQSPKTLPAMLGWKSSAWLEHNLPYTNAIKCSVASVEWALSREKIVLAGPRKEGKARRKRTNANLGIAQSTNQATDSLFQQEAFITHFRRRVHWYGHRMAIRWVSWEVPKRSSTAVSLLSTFCMCFG